MLSVYSGVLLLLFILTAVISLRLDKKHEAFLSFESTKCLKGLLSIAVLFCHIYAYWPVGLSMRIFNKMGYIAVAMFFLFAGYGLTVSANRKAKYLEGFLLKRLSKLYLPLWVSLIIVGLFSIFVGIDYDFSFENIIQDILGLNAIWFFKIIILYYIAFWVVWRYVPDRFRLFAMILFVVFQCTACFAMGMNIQYYTSSFGFLLGMVLADENTIQLLCKFDNFSNAKKGKILLVFEVVTVCSVICYAFCKEDPLLGSFVLRNIAGMCIVINIILVLWYVKIGNSISCFLGEISYEIFLVHPGVLIAIKECCKDKIFSSGIQIIIALSVTIILSTIVHYISNQVFKLLRRKVKLG